jgi:hypothetical protein
MMRICSSTGRKVTSRKASALYHAVLPHASGFSTSSGRHRPG